jgi:hypothetical protein
MYYVIDKFKECLNVTSKFRLEAQIYSNHLRDGN